MMKVQEYLINKTKSGLTNVEAFQSLTTDFAIKAKLYEDFGDRMVLLDYNQIDSPKAHPIVIECRSLILCLDTFGLVSKKFDRFFNLGEVPEFYSDFNFEGSFVMEKADGSLIGVYNRNGIWQISTRGMAKAEGEHLLGGTFRSKVIDAFGFKSEDEFQDFFNKEFKPGNTFVFEYTSPENRIVTKYDKPEMVLLNINGSSGSSMRYTTLKDVATFLKKCDLNVRLPKMYDATKDIQDLVVVANGLDNLQEGFVVWDPITDKRVKIKAKTYIVAHKLRGENAVPTRKNLLTLIFEGEVEEFIAYFPEWKESIDQVQNEIDGFTSNLMSVWHTIGHVEDQKTFALAIKNVHGSGFLFEAKKRKITPLAVFREAELNKKLRVFE